MNYSLAIFLINPNVRAIQVSYEPQEPHREPKVYTFKTFDTTITKGDLVTIPTDTRHKATVAKVEAVDVDVDFDSIIDYKWIISKIDLTENTSILAQEGEAIATIRAAEKRKHREELAKSLLANSGADLSNLSILNHGQQALAPPKDFDPTKAFDPLL